MRAAPPGGGPSGEGGADAGGGPAVLPRDADGAAHGAEGGPAVQAEDHPRLLPPVRRTGEVSRGGTRRRPRIGGEVGAGGSGRIPWRLTLSNYEAGSHRSPKSDFCPT